jgi:hypothetical protein
LSKAAVRPSDLAASQPTPVHASSDVASAPSQTAYEPLIIVLICALMALVFLFDIAMPHDDVSVPFLYVIPIFVTIFSHRWSPYPFAIFATVLSGVGACIGLVPAAISTGIGSQVQQPLACVIVGGMLLSPICSLLVIPTLAPHHAEYPQSGRGPAGLATASASRG